MSEKSNRQYALEMSNINKNFGPVTALQDVDLKIRTGYIHGLIGQNGAGKSTLMKILSGYYPHGTFDGEIIVTGEKVELKSPRDAQQSGIAIVPQEITVAGTLTVAENVLLSEFNRRGLKLYSKNEEGKAIEKFLTDNGIPLSSSQLVDTLTLPQKQILMIASALYMNPKVLVLDEPTSSLTNDEIGTLFAIVRNLKTKGYTTVFITHKIAEIMDLCDSVSILRDGRVVFETDRANFNSDTLISNMIGRSIGELYPEKNSIKKDAAVVLSVKDLVVENPRKPGEKMMDPFSFELHAGEILGLGGLVGSGRTEILKALFRENNVLAGKIQLGDGQVYGETIPEALDAGIVYITEDRKIEGLFFNATIRGNLTASILQALSAKSFLKRRSEKDIANQTSKSLSVKPSDIEEMIGNLSGGNQQKVLIGKSLLVKPMIFMLDEPTKGVDIASKSEIYQIIHELVNKGASVLLVSSEFPELLAISHRVIVFANGKLQGEIVGDINKEHELMLMAIGGK